MLNHIVIMGRLVRDPELRRTGNGTAVASFTVAVDRDFGAKDGGEKETDFIDCVAWRNTGEFVSKYFSKGSMIVVSGRLQIRNWEDNNGNRRKAAEVVASNCYFGDTKKDNAQKSGENNRSNYGGQGGYSGTGAYGGYSSTPGPSYSPPSYDYNPPNFVQLDDDDSQLPF